MFQRKQRRFRRRPNGRNLHQGKEGIQNRLRTGTYSNSESETNISKTTPETFTDKYKLRFF